MKILSKLSIAILTPSLLFMLGCPSPWFADNDSDGYGDPNNMITSEAQPAGYVSGSGDCDDTNPEINPGAEEITDDIDNDCDGLVDEDVVGTTYTVGGKMAGLVVSVELEELNSGITEIFSGNGQYSLTDSFDDNAAYNIVVMTQPSGQNCIIENGQGMINGSNVVNVNVTCGESLFQGLGYLTGGSVYSTARAISEDGSTIVGSSRSSNTSGTNQEGFVYDVANGTMVGVGDLPGGYFASHVVAVSGDGTMAIGTSKQDVDNSPEVGWGIFEYSGNPISPLGGGSGFIGHALGISGDGTKSVVRWWRSGFAGGGLYDNGTMTDIGFSSSIPYTANAISNDGLVLAGASHGSSPSGTVPATYTNGSWTHLDTRSGEARSLSADGSTVVGSLLFSSTTQAFRYENSTMTALGDMNGAYSYSSARDASADGSIVVGSGTTGSGNTAFLWHESIGMVNLQDYLEQVLGYDLTGWTLSTARGISGDGRIIVGDGVNPNGDIEAWMVEVPSLSSLVVTHIWLQGGDLDSNDVWQTSPYGWRTTTTSGFILGISDVPLSGQPDSILLNENDIFSNLPFGEYWLYAGSPSGTFTSSYLGSNPKLELSLSDGSTVFAVFDVSGSAGNDTVWAVLQGDASISMGWAQGSADQVYWDQTYQDGNNDGYFKVSYDSTSITGSTFQQLPTGYIGADVESFVIDGETYFALINGGNSVGPSRIYKWEVDTFTLVQELNGSDSTNFEYISIGADHFLFLNRYGGCCSSSTVYKWNGTSFIDYQTISTYNLHGADSFDIDGETYLAIALFNYNGFNKDSPIFKWNGTAFVQYQTIPTQGGSDFEYFSIAGEHYLLALNTYPSSQNAVVYKWNGSQFQSHQSIETTAAYGSEVFTIAGDTYMALARQQYGCSKVYKWNGSAFASFQDMCAQSIRNFESFTHAGVTYLVASNGETAEDATLYHWNGAQFVESLSIPSYGVAIQDFEYIFVDNQQFLVSASLASKVYNFSP